MVCLAYIPVAYIIEVHKAHVVARDFADFLSVLVNFTPAKVLLFECVGAVVVVANESIGFVRKGHASFHLVQRSANEHA